MLNVSGSIIIILDSNVWAHETYLLLPFVGTFHWWFFFLGGGFWLCVCM